MPSKPKTVRREHQDYVIHGIWALSCIGYGPTKIRETFTIPLPTIKSILKRLKKSQDEPWKKARRTGRPPKLDKRAERRLVRHLERFPFETYSVMNTPGKTTTAICRATFQRYLRKNEYYAFKPRKKPFLKPQHKERRLAFARRFKNLTVDDWACVCFSDESTFEVGLASLTQYVKRKAGNARAYESKYLQPTFKSGRSSVGIWGAISLDFKSDLAVLKRGQRMNSILYCNKVLAPYAQPFYARITEERGIAIWQEDGAAYHTSAVTREYRKSLGMEELTWPAQSPDLNPIETLWHIMKQRISKRRHRINTIQEMETVIKEEWEKLSPEDWRKCIASMPQRMAAVIKAKGGSTRW